VVEAFAELGPGGAFLPPRVPPEHLPPPFDGYTAACEELAERLTAAAGTRRWLDRRFAEADGTVEAVAGLDDLGAHKLLSTLTALAHAYRWNTLPPAPERFAEWRIELPAGIADPLAVVAKRLEHPRHGTTWSLHLCNWRMTDRPGGATFVPAELDRERLRIAFPWLAPPRRADLEAFSLTFVLTEARGAEVLDAVRHAFSAVAEEDVHETGYALDKLAGAVERMAEPFVRTIRNPHVDTRTWLEWVQPLFAWAADTSEPAGLATPGPSGMQTGVIQALDAALTVPAESFLGRAALDGRRFMPGHHRRFLAALDAARGVLPGFVEAARDPQLAFLFNECVRGLRTWRVVHQKRGAQYLRAGRTMSGPRVSTGLAVPWTPDRDRASQTTAVAMEDDAVATFERTMTERILETSRAFVAGEARRDSAIPLPYLSAHDNRLIFAGVERRRIAPGEEVIRPDERRQALYAIRSGSVRIAPAGEGLPAGRLGAGEVFGELAFLLNSGAPAGVTAEEPLEVDVLTRDHLYRVLGGDPALTARFYESLAVLEAGRLRDTVRRGIRAADLPQETDPRLARAGPAPAETLALLAGLVEADADHVAAAGDALVDHLMTLAPAVAADAGRHVLRLGFPVLAASRLLRHALLGGARSRRDLPALTHALAGTPSGEPPLGEAVDAWALGLPSFASLRTRVHAIAQAVGDAHAVTYVESLPMPLPAARAVICVDSDLAALESAVGGGPARGVHENILHVARGLARIPLPRQDAIVCTGAVEFLPDRDAVRVVDWAHATLRPGGRLVLAGPAPASRDGAFLEHVAGWARRRRSPEHMAHLFTRSEFVAAHVDAWIDPTGATVYATARRA
jgi:extracellular factor (EF) 3-hydroxypalmitic acid methyl ester biosynthesis protein